MKNFEEKINYIKNNELEYISNKNEKFQDIRNNVLMNNNKKTYQFKSFALMSLLAISFSLFYVVNDNGIYKENTYLMNQNEFNNILSSFSIEDVISNEDFVLLEMSSINGGER